MNCALAKFFQTNYFRRPSILKIISNNAAFSKSDNSEPLHVKYRAAMKQDIPLDDLPLRVNFRGKPYKPAELDESLKYVDSTEFQKLYRGKPVWYFHRRNYKGHFPPKYPRKSCTRAHKLITSNPCPICRDEYLILSFQNVSLLKHFLHPLSADILEPKVTGLCEHQHKTLLIEIEKARDIGSLQMRLPFRLFDYVEYYGEEAAAQLGSHVVSGTRGGGQLGPRTTELRKFAMSLNRLPPSLASLLREAALIPHIEEVVAEPPAAEIAGLPNLPNRYQMEENYRKLLLKRRRAKSILLDE